MKNKIICLLLVVLMCFSIFALAACGKTDNPGNEGGNGDVGGNEGNGGNGGNGGNNDDEEEDITPGGPPPIADKDVVEGWWEDITYDNTELLFQLTHCDNAKELPSGCERYLEGNTADDEDIDKYVDERNQDAESYTFTTIKYSYVDNIQSTYGFLKNIERIQKETSNKNQNTPDLYCNFMSDMLCTSLLGSFANARSMVRGSEQDQHGVNYFDLSIKGYMADLMSSLTLSLDKIYVIASDYFIDLIRAFFIVPVNVTLYNEVASKDSKLEDYTNDGIKDINDFFEEVKNGKWTYDRVADYSAAAYKPGDGNTGGMHINDNLGFGLADNGLPAAGMVYTSSVVIINKEWDSAAGKFNYSYPDENPDLVRLATNLSALMDKTGVKFVTAGDGAIVGVTGEGIPNLTVRKQFTNNKMLFGGVMLVGALEYPDFQLMKSGNSGGFGVAPVPVFEYDEEKEPADQYLTQIHVVGRAGGIAVCTKKFAQCTAFIQYQSTHSTDILNEYYDYNLTYDTAGGLDGNIEMLQYIRDNVRTSFDKLFEDAIGYYFKTVNENSEANRWHALIVAEGYKMDSMSDTYESLIDNKKKSLADLEKMYTELPD